MKIRLFDVAAVVKFLLGLNGLDYYEKKVRKIFADCILWLNKWLKSVNRFKAFSPFFALSYTVYPNTFLVFFFIL